MKEWTGAIVLLVVIFVLAVGFFKVGLPLIERTITAAQQHNARNLGE